MLKLVRYLRGYGKECVLAPLFKCLEAAFQILVPLVMASVVDEGIAAGNTHHIMASAAALIAMGVVGWVCAVAAQYFSAKLGAGFGTALRDDLFAHVMSLSRSNVDELGTSTLVTRLTNDTSQVQDGVNLFFRLVLRCPIAILGSIGAAYLVSGTEGALFVVVSAIVFLLVWLVMRVAIRGYREVQHGLDGVLLSTAEQLEGVRVLRAFGREDEERRLFDDLLDGLWHRQVYVGDVSGLMNPLTYAAVNLGLVVVLYVGGISIQAGNLTQGALVALVNYMSQMLVELLKLANLVNTLSKSEACARRVNEVFERVPSMTDGELSADGLSGSIEFCDVTFSYPGAAAPSLSHVSFSARPGQVVGVIGGTGSGKSTLASLLMRFYDATSGSVLVGGRDVRTLTLESLHRLVSIVDQRPRLFSGTIESNLRLAAPDASPDQLEHAVEAAQAADVVAAKGGVAGAVEQLGRNLSGGQRQRLSIARILSRGPRILVLDDASSALDLATDARLRHALASEFPGVTQVVISQRISAIRHADLILVLDAGRVVGQGTHEELRRTCDVYEEICASQLEGEEVRHG
ncbi:multidrug ABC transporter ATP-binding and permease protein [Parolsenella catena]|uniref:Multidrug ABC transporter ATP-binding and permease protein n=1 Tax=Parolsenella catena TaxID=2003188 RepID=A0A3G9K1K9_9ACTN|nr:ABC transporter ATP-binding protein [Parolsenella catena]BBH50206.1 multidrug ABC transporter ATP-binding and permease protein [Parolsenella catena]